MRRKGSSASAIALALALASASCSYTPPELEVTEPKLAQSSKIFAADGRLVTTLLAEQNRENVRLVDLPPHVPDAVVAIEDARFWEHRGVDVKAILRAAAANASEGDVVEGGSTITQQYVKNTLLNSDQTIERKVEEALLAVELERNFTKARILELYLNTIFFGNGAYGIQAAAEEYFGVTAKNLTVAQSATLAGLIRAPSAYDPYDWPEAAVGRRNGVIDRMTELELIEADLAAAAISEPLELAVPTPVERYPAGHFVEQVKRFVLDDPRFGATRQERLTLLFGGGLRITTTLDLDMQAKAEQAVAQIRPVGPGPDAALVAIEAGSGFVRSLVGGRDFFGDGPEAKLDLATGGPGRPAGSSFKPFVLAAALEEGIPLNRVYAAPSHIEIPLVEGTWKVENYEGSSGGHADLRLATVNSYNTVYAQLIQEVGPTDAMAMADRLGISTELFPYPSAVLGTNDVHPLDMAGAYSTFANRGVRVAPVFVTKVATLDGTILYQHQHAQARVLDADIADRVTDVLQAVVTEGTGARATIDRPVAGKTGTGQEWRDAWFVGYTPELVTAVWMGFAEEGRRSMVPPLTPFRITGGRWPAEIFSIFMAAALAGTPVTGFPAVPPLPPLPVPVIVDPNLFALRDVLGAPLPAAQEALTADGLFVNVVAVASDQVPIGHVAATEPPPGTPVLPGSTVTVKVANGPPVLVSVPSVLGLDEATAIAVLGTVGLGVELVYEAEPPAPGAADRVGRVWKQSPAASISIVVGGMVRIWINPVPPPTA